MAITRRYGNLPDRVPSLSKFLGKGHKRQVEGLFNKGGSPLPARGDVPPLDPHLRGQIVKRSVVEVDGERWERLNIRTHVILAGEDIVEVVLFYTLPHLQPHDLIFISEKAVAGSQGRAIPVKEIQPGRLARFLASKVRPVPWGYGLSKPETMEMAIREAGVCRILLAASVHAVTRLFGRKGDFYRIAGQRVTSIDGPDEPTAPPYDQCVTLMPLHSDDICRQLVQRVRRWKGPHFPVEAAIVDVNDLGSVVLGASQGVHRKKLARILADNPLGQGPYITPIGILRRAPEETP
ncbi:MAG: coenzyme F420-0:L-glutamate ligase [Clostridiales bacterium]|nr:coenzyme F420-0:L-glutamate ligase [Clostridiales bacterium]